MYGEELEYVKEAYEINWMSTVGANINVVEKLTCEKIGSKYAVVTFIGVMFTKWEYSEDDDAVPAPTTLKLFKKD